MPDTATIRALIEALPAAALAAIVSGGAATSLCLWFVRGYMATRDARDAEERAKVFDQWAGLEARREERHAKQIEVLESLKATSDRVVRVLEHCERQAGNRRYGV